VDTFWIESDRGLPAHKARGPYETHRRHRLSTCERVWCDVKLAFPFS